MKKAQMNSEILKWILMIIIFAVVVMVIILLQQGLPQAVLDIIQRVGEIL